MKDEGKQHSPYRGVPVIAFLMVVFPIVFTVIFYLCIKRFQNFSDELNWASARALGLGMGCILYLACAVSGVYREPFSAMVDRLKDFFGNLSVSFRLACKIYWEDVKSEGVVFLIYAVIIIAAIILAVDSVQDCLVALSQAK